LTASFTSILLYIVHEDYAMIILLLNMDMSVGKMLSVIVIV